MRLVAGFAFAACTLAAAADAHAYCRTTTCDPQVETCHTNADGCVKDGAPVTWSSMPLVYRFSSRGSAKLDPTSVREAFRSAASRWASVECANGRTSLRFQEHADFEQEGTPFGIVFRDDAWDHPHAQDTFAVTNVTYGTVFGDISTADIEINTAQFDFTFDGAPGGTDFEAIVTHELGHYIGLAHSTDPASIMVPRYCETPGRCATVDTARALADDDVLAVCALYPPEGIAGVDHDAATSSGCDASGARGGSGGGTIALAIAMAAACRRRRLSDRIDSADRA